MRFCPLYRLLAADVATGLSGQMAAMALLSTLVLLGEGGAGTVLGFSTALQVPALVVVLLGAPFLDRIGCGKSLLPLHLARGLIIILLSLCWKPAYLALALLAVATCLDGLFRVSRNALVPDLADGRSLLYVNGVMLRFGVAGGLLGPILAGYMIVWGGTQICLTAAGVLCVVLAPLLLRLPEGKGLPREDMEWVREFKDGIKLAMHNRELIQGISVLLVSSLGGGLMNFTVPLWFKIRGFTADVYGVTLAGFALGQLSATFILEHFSPQRKGTYLPYWTFMVQGAGMGGTLLADHALSVGTIFAIMGVGSGASQIFLDSFFQEKAAIGYRGRIMAFTGVLRAICYITAGVAGAVLSCKGPATLVIAAALITAGSGILTRVTLQMRIRCNQ
jgi:MFS family permease